MDPKTILALCATLIIVSNTVKSLLNITGMIKTEVKGGAEVGAIYLATSIVSVIGWGTFLILLVINRGTIFNAVSCFFN